MYNSTSSWHLKKKKTSSQFFYNPWATFKNIWARLLILFRAFFIQVHHVSLSGHVSLSRQIYQRLKPTIQLSPEFYAGKFAFACLPTFSIEKKIMKHFLICLKFLNFKNYIWNSYHYLYPLLHSMGSKSGSSIIGCWLRGLPALNNSGCKAHLSKPCNPPLCKTAKIAYNLNS